MATVSDTSICNLALAKVGGKRQITNLETDTGTAAELLRAQYDFLRDSVLRAYPWNFAIKRVELALSSDTPSHEYDNVFALPSDCLKVIRTSWEADNVVSADANCFSYENYPPYRIEGKKLLTNESSVKIEYISQVTDPAQFDAQFVDVFSVRLAAEIAYPLTKDRGLVRDLRALFEALLPEARTSDSQEGTPRDVTDTGGWIRARL